MLSSRDDRIQSGNTGTVSVSSEPSSIHAMHRYRGAGVAGGGLGRPHGDVGGAGRAGRGHHGRLPVRLDGPEEEYSQHSVLVGTDCPLTHPFLSSSFLMSEVMSKPLKGFWSGSLVGEENLLSLSTSCWLHALPTSNQTFCL